MTIVNSFADLAKACGLKNKDRKKNRVMKCPNCGGQMREVEGSNVWICDFSKLEEKDLDGKKVQVFSTCGNFILNSAG